MVDALSRMWLNLTSSGVYRSWPEAGWNPIYGLTDMAGFYDNTPLFDLLSGLFSTKKIKKRIIVSANDANSGSYVNMKLHEYDNDHEKIISSVVGSASVPFFFPPRNMSKFG